MNNRSACFRCKERRTDRAEVTAPGRATQNWRSLHASPCWPLAPCAPPVPALGGWTPGQKGVETSGGQPAPPGCSDPPLSVRPSPAPGQPDHEPGPLQGDHLREALRRGHAVVVEGLRHPRLLRAPARFPPARLGSVVSLGSAGTGAGSRCPARGGAEAEPEETQSQGSEPAEGPQAGRLPLLGMLWVVLPRGEAVPGVTLLPR